MKATVQMALSTIRILALHALVKEQLYRVLHKRKHYTVSGAICGLINAMAKQDHSIMLAPNCRAVQNTCEAIRRLPEVTDEKLLEVAREWDSLPKEAVMNPLQMTPAFASLMRTVSMALARDKQTKRRSQNPSRQLALV